MSNYPTSTRQPVTSWEPDSEELLKAGVKPGIYEHFKGGEYLTLTVGWRMSENGTDETVNEKVVIYAALYDHPDYGPNAVWDRSVEGFKENILHEGKEVPRFKFKRSRI